MRPIKRTPQLITQMFNAGVHNGVDLRCVDDVTGKNLQVVATERCEVLRVGKDNYGNYFLVVKPLEENDYKELKYIHIDPVNFSIGDIIERNDFISFCRIGGNSKALHLHFETWKESASDPLDYFDLMEIEYRIKGG
jgi:hypothetical protein